MRRPGRIILRTLLAALLLAAVFAAFWFGLVPQRYSPLAPISLDEPPSWFADFRLAALRRDPDLCQAVLREPHITATPIPDSGIKDGCGWVNAVRLSAVGGAEIGVDKLTCEEAAALALWIEYEVQPLAQATFGSRVTGLEDMGAYECRNMIGNSKWTNMRSQHALANAIDISGFRLADGRVITVAKGYKGSGPEAAFLRAAHMRACKYFRVAIGPEFNAAHWNHLHLDRGPFRRCK
jgi:hypothetical protein